MMDLTKPNPYLCVYLFTKGMGLIEEINKQFQIL